MDGAGEVAHLQADRFRYRSLASQEHLASLRGVVAEGGMCCLLVEAAAGALRSSCIIADDLMRADTALNTTT